MKLKPLVIAIAALSVGVANAYTNDASNVYMTGASAIRGNVAAGIKKMCTAAGGSLTVFKNGAGASALANQMAYVCTQPLAGTSITKVFHTTTGGSLNSILGMSNNVALQQQPLSGTFAGCDAAATAGTGDLAGYSVKANCALDAAVSSNGGFSDVEYGPAVEQVNILTSATDGFTLADVTPGFTGVAQAFGIAVSEKMYKDLQTAQGLGACGVGLGDPTPVCQPSLNRADVASLINNNLFAPAKNGAQALGLTANAQIEYARRPATSGTQTSAQVYFLGKGCLNGANFGEFDVIGNEIATGATKSYGTKFKVSVNSGTGDVKNALIAAGNTSYAFGVVSMENRAPTTTTSWKFVKLNGVSISDGTSSGLNKTNALNGKYDYFVETAVYTTPLKTDTDEQTVISAIASEMATPVALGGFNSVGLFEIPENAGGYDNATYPTEVGLYQRGGSTPNSCQPVSRPQ
ncbi:MAG: hypothetical protein WBH09_04950 [Rugosibacter sp.]